MQRRVPSLREFEAIVQRRPVHERPLYLRRRVTMGQYRHPYAVTAAMLGAATDVLDWGCGNGHFTAFLLEAGCTVTGYSYEGAPALDAHASRFRFVPGSPGEPTRLPFADASFDAVFSVGVLEHVHEFGGEQQASFDELMRVLRPGGTLLIFHLPNRTSWVEAMTRMRHRFGGPAGPHGRLFDASDVREYLTGHAAELRRVGRYNVLPRNSWLRLPAALSDSPFVARVVNWVDDLLGATLPWVAQNWYFVIRKSSHA